MLFFKYLFSVIAIIILLLIQTGCVKIETGQTVEEAVQSSEVKARQIRASWAQRFQQASPSEMTLLLVNNFEQVINIYIDFGFKNVKRWREGEVGRNEKIKDSEMRTFIDRWVNTQRPILNAYEDNLEYGLERIKQTGYFNDDILESVKQLISQYYKVYSIVFFPKGTVEDYEYELDNMKYKTSILIEKFKAEVEPY